MISNILAKTAPKPSFGMPVVDSASVARACADVAFGARRRAGADVVSAHAVATAPAALTAAIWGTSAWRPPTC